MADQDTAAAEQTAEVTETGLEPDATTSDADLPQAVSPETAAAVLEAVAAHGGDLVMATAFVKQGLTAEQAGERAKAAKDIRGLVALAKQDAALADQFIQEGKSLDAVRAALFDKLVASQSDELSPHVATDSKPARVKASADWEKAIARVSRS